MTVRVLRPVITLTTIMAILVTAIGAYAFLTVGTSHADSTYKPTTVVKFCKDMGTFIPDPSFTGGGYDLTIPGGGPTQCNESTDPEGKNLSANPDITNLLDYVSGDLNFSNVVTLAPNSQVISQLPETNPAVKIGALHSESTLGTLNGPCNVLFPVDFVFFNIALPNGSPNPRAVSGGGNSTNIAFPQPEGTAVRFGRWQVGTEPAAGGGTAITTAGGFGVNIADGTNIPMQNYPSYLLNIFDPDFIPGGTDGAAVPLVPHAAYGGLSRVAGEWIPLYFVQFAAGGLAGMPAPLGSLTAAMGQPSVSVLTDPSAVQASPSAITDFCTPLQVTTLLLGKQGADVRITNPGTAQSIYQVQYNASLRDTDQDSYENAIDTCPFNVNVGNPRIAGSGDPDGNGIDASCDVGLGNSQNDYDGDLFQNRQDNCPLVANGIPIGAGPAAQKEDELGSGAAADEGPRTDSVGNVCDSEAGTKSYIQNCSATCGTGVTITMSDTVGNGRYMTVSNFNAKCIGGTDVDNDGYCTLQDNADSGICATQSPPSCATRHSPWTGATHPGLQMDTDGDKQSDALETYVGTDPVQSCSQFATPNNEPMDNWMFDLNDDRIINGSDSGAFGGAGGGMNRNVVNGPFNGRPGVRYDFNNDGIISGSDTGKFGGIGPYGGTGPFNKSCATAGIPAFVQQ